IPALPPATRRLPRGWAGQTAARRGVCPSLGSAVLGFLVPASSSPPQFAFDPIFTSAALCHVSPGGFSLEMIGHAVIMAGCSALGPRPREGGDGHHPDADRS